MRTTLSLLVLLSIHEANAFSNTFISTPNAIPYAPPRKQCLTYLNVFPPTKQKKELNIQPTVEEANEIQIQPGVQNEDSIFGIPKETAKPLAWLLFAQFILFIGVGAVIPSIPLYGKEIGLSSAANGIVISAPALALLFLAKPAGQYADRSRKPAMMWGMAVIALSDLGTAMAQSIVPLIIARLGLGAGRGISESGERGMLADLASTIPELRGRALSIQQAVVALGIAIGAPAGGVVVEQYGPRAAFLCVTAAAFLALLMYTVLPETLEGSKTIQSSQPSDSDEKIKMEKEIVPNETVAWKELLKQSEWRGLSLFEVGARFGYAAKLASIPILASSILPGGAIGAGALLSATGISGLIGGPAGGYLADRIGAKNTIIITGISSGIGLILVPFALQITSPEFLPDGAAFSAAVLIWSTSVAAQGPATNAYAQEIAPAGSTATAMALPRAAGDGVYLFAPFLLGLVSDANVPDGTDCAIAGISGLLGITALSLSKKR